MELRGKNIAILVEQQYEDLEFWYPKLRLLEADAEVTVIGVKPGAEYPSKYGYGAMADRGIAEAEAAQFDAVTVPGGYSPDHMRRTPAMVELVREAFAASKVVAAICHAGWVLPQLG